MQRTIEDSYTLIPLDHPSDSPPPSVSSRRPRSRYPRTPERVGVSGLLSAGRRAPTTPRGGLPGHRGQRQRRRGRAARRHDRLGRRRQPSRGGPSCICRAPGRWRRWAAM